MAERSFRKPSPIGAWLFVTLQRLLPQHALSRLAFQLARCRVTPIKNALIDAFVRAYRPRMAEAAAADPHSYASLNEFFTRALRSDARPLGPGEHLVACPVDGSVSEIGYLQGQELLQAKGRTYRLDALLAGDAEWTSRLAGGAFATLYLAPYDYHRIHMPLAGRLRAAWYVPGRRFSVNAVTAQAVAALFARNERVVCAFESGDGLPFAMVLVGALCVGSIATVWHGEIAPGRRTRRVLALQTAAGELARGAEMGRFNMGSTVILLLPAGAARWGEDIGAGATVRVGQTLAQLSAGQ